MKILFDNTFEQASFAATNESLNYPVTNLTHPFLQKRFQSSGTSSVITASFDSDQSISCFFYGYHTVASMTVVFKNSGGGTLLTLNITDPQDIGVEYFSLLTTVRSVEITISGSEPLYLGGVGAGQCYMMDDPLAAYSGGDIDNSDYIESPHGQTLQTYVEPLRELSYGFRDQEGVIKSEVNQRFRAAGIGKGLYFDLYENNRDKEPPIYAKMTESFRFEYSPRRYGYGLKIREAR